jgi:hypothetical protein
LLGRERALGLLDLALELAERAEVRLHVRARLLLVRLDEEVHHALVEVLATKVGVAGGRENLKDAVVDREEGDIEGTTTQVVDDDALLAALLIEAVRDSGSRGLVNDTENVQAGDDTSVLGRLTLSVVEVCTGRLRT